MQAQTTQEAVCMRQKGKNIEAAITTITAKHKDIGKADREPGIRRGTSSTQ